jgi:hypothetical protein
MRRATKASVVAALHQAPEKDQRPPKRALDLTVAELRYAFAALRE